jgi:hypothetical protein
MVEHPQLHPLPTINLPDAQLDQVINEAFLEVVSEAELNEIPTMTHEQLIHQNNQVIDAIEAVLGSDTESESDIDGDDEVPVTHVSSNHGVNWNSQPDGFNHAINGTIPYKEWGLRLPTGDVWRDGANTDEAITRLDVFLQMFPKTQLHDTFILTNL